MSLFPLCELCHFLTSDSMKVYRHGYHVSTTPHTIYYWSFWNFAHVFSMVLRCACGLDIILELFFVTFFTLWTFVIFWPQILWKRIDSGYIVSTTPYTISILSSCSFAHLFFHGLKICMWFGFNPAINFCHFSTLLTLSFFSFSQVRHQLHRSSIYIYLLMCKTISQIVDSATKNLILIDVINYISDACTKKTCSHIFLLFSHHFYTKPSQNSINCKCKIFWKSSYLPMLPKLTFLYIVSNTHCQVNLEYNAT